MSKDNKEKWEAIKSIVEVICGTTLGIITILAIFGW